jgi:hypothetical protein
MDLAIALGQGAGLAIACGLVSLLPVGVGALAALLGLEPGHRGVYDDTAIVIAAIVAGLLSAVAAPRLPRQLRIALGAIGGALVFELSAGHELPYAGIAIGAVLGGLAAWVGSAVIGGALEGEGTTGGVATVAGGGSTGLSVVSIIPFVGFAVTLACAWFALRVRRAGGKKYGGLRSLA